MGTIAPSVNTFPLLGYVWVAGSWFCSHFSNFPFLFPGRVCFPLVTSLSPHGFLKLIARASNVTRDFFCLSQSEYNISEKQKQSRNHFEKPYLPVEGSSKFKLLKTTSSLLGSPLYLADKRRLSEMVDSIAKGSGFSI